MLQTKGIFTLLIIAIAAVSGCTSSTANGDQVSDDGTTIAPEIDHPDNMGSSGGQVELTEFANNYYRYDPEAYQQALSDGKVVFLFFRANWCPLCNAQRPKIINAFNGLESENIVGFEAHYNDDETEPYNVELAALHQVPYQDTKIVIDHTGTVVLKTLEHLEQDKIESEILAAM